MKPHEVSHGDTSAAAARVLAEIYGAMPTWRKLQLADDANRAAAYLAMSGLRARHPDEALERLRRRLVGLTLGEELATRVFGPLDPP